MGIPGPLDHIGSFLRLCDPEGVIGLLQLRPILELLADVSSRWCDLLLWRLGRQGAEGGLGSLDVAFGVCRLQPLP